MFETKTMAAVATAVTALCMATGGQAGTELIFNSYLPKMNVAAKAGIWDFADQVAEISGGELTITIPQMSLAPSDQQYELLMDGVADIAWLPVDDLAQMVTLSTIANIPYNAPTPKSASIALWETYKTYFESFGEFRGVKLLGVYALLGRQPMGMGFPVDSATAFQGKKVWVPNGPLTDVIEGLGGIPVHVNFPQVFEAMTKGQMDMLVASPGAVVSSGAKDMVNYMTVIPGGLGTVSFFTAISDEAWDRLSEQERAWLLEAAEGLSDRLGEATGLYEQRGLEVMTDLQIIEAPEDLMARVSVLLDAQVEEWKVAAKAKGLENPDEVLEFYRSVLARETAQ